jgi:hypothetical protein
MAVAVAVAVVVVDAVEAAVLLAGTAAPVDEVQELLVEAVGVVVEARTGADWRGAVAPVR